MIWAAISRTFLSSSSRHSAMRCSALGQCLRAAIFKSQITTVLGFCPGGRPRRPFEEPSGLPDWPFGNRLMLGSLSCPRSYSILVYKANGGSVRSARLPRLLDHLVSGGQQRFRDGEAEGVGSQLSGI